MSRSVQKIIVLGGLIGAAALLSGGCQPQPGSDDDRPPIIVSDGSIHLRAVGKDAGAGTNHQRGSWTTEGGQWVHDHGGPKARHLLVNVLYGSGSADCGNPEHVFKVRELTVTFTDAMTSADTAFRIFVEDPNGTAPGRLMTNASGTVDPNVPFWLNVGAAGDRLKSVAFPSLNVTCTLEAGKGQIHIYQSTKNVQ
jgi:hypothetical protein